MAPDEPAVRTLAIGLSNRTFPFLRYDLGDEVPALFSAMHCHGVDNPSIRLQAVETLGRNQASGS